MAKQNRAFILNLCIFLLELVGFIIALSRNGIKILGLYTQLSNLILMIASGIYIYDRIKNKDSAVSKMAALWKYIATCLVTVTFVVVIFVFVPMCLPDIQMALYVVFDGASMFHHFICPILALISFFTYENDLDITIKEALFAMCPTLFYAIVSTSLNVLKVVEGPYPFLYVYKQPVWASVLWFIGIPGFGFIFAVIVGKIKNAVRKGR